MKPEFETIELHKNESKKRFEIEYKGHYAFIDYKEIGDKISLVHTEADPELEGSGAATAVVEKTLAYIQNHQKTLLPYCPFVFAYIKRHPEWKAIVDPSFIKINEL